MRLEGTFKSFDIPRMCCWFLWRVTWRGGVGVGGVGTMV